MDNSNYLENEKIAFRELCLKRQDIPIFLTAQWLDVVAKDSWNVVNEYENGGIIAFFVFKLRRKLTFKIIEVPILTMYSGLYFLTGFSNVKDIISKENRLVRSILKKLPLFDKVNISLHNSITNLQVFGWEGYDLNLRYTYQINNINEYSIDSLSNQYRRIVKSAAGKHRLEFIEDAEDFYSVFKSFLIKRNRIISFKKELLVDLFQYSKKYNIGKGFCARSIITNEIGAVCYVVWDNTTAYLLLTGHDPELIEGANQYLIFEVIKYLSNYVNTFDFEGSMIEGVESNYRNMGGKQRTYYHVKRTRHNVLRIIESIRV